MDRQRVFIGILIVALLLAATVAGTYGQGPEPEVDAPAANEPQADMDDIIPIQGRLTDDGGKPLNGNYSVRFSIYDEQTGGTALCEDTDTVPVANGLFNAKLDFCTSEAIDGRQLWLGIRVEGEDEMTPRQGIYAVPYAWGLRPGAIISGTIAGGATLHVENDHTNGRGVYGYATATSGANFGVMGRSDSVDGSGGYFYNSELGTGVSGIGYDGVHGYSPTTFGSGVLGQSDFGNGVRATTGDPTHNYGVQTPDNLYSRNYHLPGAQMQVVRNGGQEALEPGDVVIFGGLEAGDPPMVQVARATVANSTAVAGVVYSRYNLAAIPEDPEQVPEGDREVTPAGPVPPGEYLLMVIQGPAQVKASALAGAIQPGDLLSSAGPAGQAAKAVQVSIEGVQTAVPGTVFGKALEPLDEGDKLIYVFVTLQ